MNPQTPQGVLNLLRASASILSLPQLNVTASNLAEWLIALTFEGDASGYIPVTTGAVPSPYPYMMVNTALHIVRSQALANAWKQQVETFTTIGDIVVQGDASTLENYYLSNCTIMNVDSLSFAGRDASFTVNIRGTYYVNATMWN